MNTLEAYAHHGSTSYGPLAPQRLKDILFGDIPVGAELARVEQALMETPGAYAYDLAVELGITYESLNDRARKLLGRDLPQ
jgi:hypothetical protein